MKNLVGGRDSDGSLMAEAESTFDGENVVIAVDASLVNSNGSECSNDPRTFTIFEIPKVLKEVDERAYLPKILSIGPFHRYRRDIMEGHKWRYREKVLTRSEGKGNNGLEMYINELKKIEEEAQNSYVVGNSDRMGSKEFVEMMLLDGCFIIQLLLQLEEGVETNEPIYSEKWMLPYIGHDLLLLDNQLPFFVLERLWELTGRSDLRKSVLDFFRNLLPEEHDLKVPDTCVHHLLHLIHSCLTPSSTSGKMSQCIPLSSLESELKPTPPPKRIPSATELREAGIKFRRKKARSFLDITFEKGLMEIPRLTISDYTGSLFRNLIALEQCFPNCSSHFTSYCFLMDSLINTPKDVALLKQADIIEHVLGSDEEVALLFNKLCKGVTGDFKNGYLAEVFKGVIQHTQKRWPKWRAKLVHDYFSNPWSILSLIAAIVILILTFLQTYFATFTHFNPP